MVPYLKRHYTSGAPDHSTPFYNKYNGFHTPVVNIAFISKVRLLTHRNNCFQLYHDYRYSKTINDTIFKYGYRNVCVRSMCSMQHCKLEQKVINIIVSIDSNRRTQKQNYKNRTMARKKANTNTSISTPFLPASKLQKYYQFMQSHSKT